MIKLLAVDDEQGICVPFFYFTSQYSPAIISIRV